jgi:hypothetical protein
MMLLRRTVWQTPSLLSLLNSLRVFCVSMNILIFNKYA